MKIGSKARGVVTSVGDIVAPNVQCPTSNVQHSIQNCDLESFCHRTFTVRCWMFGVSVLILISDGPPLGEIFSQILAAVADLDRRDLRRVDQRHVRRAHVAIHRSLLALVEAGHVAEGNLDNPRCCSQMRACYGICRPGSFVMASTAQPSSAAHKSLDGLWRSVTGLRTLCRKRRISPDVR